jgi:hypothetical protein
MTGFAQVMLRDLDRHICFIRASLTMVEHEGINDRVVDAQGPHRRANAS